MHRIEHLGRLVPIAALALGACVVAPYDHYGRHDGTVTFAWTLGGSGDPSMCELAGAPLVRIVVWDAFDGVVGDDFAACSALGARYFVEHGWYTASLSLAEVSGADVDGATAVGPFYVTTGFDTFVPVDLALPFWSVTPTASRVSASRARSP